MGYLERDRNVDLVKAFPMGTNNIACGKAASAATLGILFIRNFELKRVEHGVEIYALACVIFTDCRY